MLIGIVADTHDRLPMIDAAVALFARQKVEALIHAGDFVAPFALKRLMRFDGPLYATYGNNDGERQGLKGLLPGLGSGPLLLELDGRSILVHHYLGWCDASDIDRADVVVTGHTHEPEIRADHGKLFVNPGECCGWVTGRCTTAILDTKGPSARIHDLEAS